MAECLKTHHKFFRDLAEKRLRPAIAIVISCKVLATYTNRSISFKIYHLIPYGRDFELRMEDSAFKKEGFEQIKAIQDTHKKKIQAMYSVCVFVY